MTEQQPWPMPPPADDREPRYFGKPSEERLTEDGWMEGALVSDDEVNGRRAAIPYRYRVDGSGASRAMTLEQAAIALDWFIKATGEETEGKRDEYGGSRV